MHTYWHHEGLTDLQAIRSDAALRAAGKWIYAKRPEESVIHMHPQSTSDTYNCKDRGCEYISLTPPEEVSEPHTGEVQNGNVNQNGSVNQNGT